MTDYITRAATAEDIPALVAFRAQMFRDMGWTDEDVLAQLTARYGGYLADEMDKHEFSAWVAEDAVGQVVASVGLLWQPIPPTARNLSGRQAYILGLYVVPKARREGLGRALTEMVVAHAREEGAVVIALHASEFGRRIYEKLGFVPTTEMRLFTDPTTAAWAPRKPVSEDDE